MAFSERSLDDYVDVAQRIADFREQYPSGSLQPADPAKPWEQAVVNGYDKQGKAFAATMIVYVAAAYRTPDDPRPGIGIAWEAFPGRTPYTLGSELMNAETSAWGRAIIAVLASDSKKGVASRQEVRSRRAERDDGLPTNANGSLSRSRTSDEEKATAGVMTSAQMAEHTALGGGNPRTPKAERGSVTRLPTTPPDDPWQDQSPGPSPFAQSAEDKPGSIGPAQRRQMHAAFNKLGVTARAERLELTAGIVGRRVESSNDLSFVEARALLEGLEVRVGAMA